MIIQRLNYIIVLAILPIIIVATPFFIKVQAADAPCNKTWARAMVDQYPELLWLTKEGVALAAEGSSVAGKKTWSTCLFSESYDEFDRTLMGVQCFEWLLSGTDDAYKQFVSAQAKNKKLSYTSFQQLHKELLFLLKNYPELSEEIVKEMMVTALILGDLGKSHYTREKFKPYGIEDPDHDDFYDHMVLMLLADRKLLNILPSLEKLPVPTQEYLGYIAGLGHIGHMTHLEDGKGMFTALTQSQVVAHRDDYALRMFFFLHICDVAGALGHVCQNSSLVLTQEAYDGIHIVQKACALIVHEHQIAEQAYLFCLQQRGKKLGFLHYKEPTQRMLIHMGCFARLYSKAYGKALLQGLQDLPSRKQKLITKVLNDYFDNTSKKTYTYMPAVVVNAINNLALKKKYPDDLQRIRLAIKLTLPVIAEALQMHQKNLQQGIGNVAMRLNFYPLVMQDKTKNLNVFARKKIHIDYQPGEGYGKVKLLSFD